MPKETASRTLTGRVRGWLLALDRAEALLFLVQAVLLWKISQLPS